VTRGAPAIMLQGTGSHVGKSVLAAGFCRLLARRGLHVLPFKSQNMSNNAYVTADGGEMGWAQAMQAEAANVDACVDMNPVLLKPESGHRCQVIRHGRRLVTVDARAYYRLTGRLWPSVVASYGRLAREAEVLVIEGAGSPAEPNLRRRDIANMRVARLARARVLIVGDIDRGGVFASLTGTMALLNPRERHLVHGFMINKFRGDASFLTSALADLSRRTRRPVLGVVPWLDALGLGEEDSQGLTASTHWSGRAGRVAVIHLPRIANATDFAPLEAEPGVEVRFIDAPAPLAKADLVIVPGSKDTLADLRFLEARGLAGAIARHAARGGALLGICGGYQMLGARVDDPEGVEGGGSAPGLDLLPVRTRFRPAKTTRRVRARWLPDGPTFEGYEIRAGVTRPCGRAHALVEVGGRPAGFAAVSGRVWGISVHGLFDSAASRRHVLAWAGTCAAEGEGGDHRARRERAYDRLADALEAAVPSGVLDDLLRPRLRR
jgi:adenosylcobyric acid synthase